MSATQIKRCSHRHEAIIDWLIANPHERNLAALCRHINVSRSWLSIVMRSDAFRAEYVRRRDEYNQGLAEGIQRKMYDVANAALDRVLETLEDDDDENFDPRFALDAADKVTKNLGFGPSKGNGPAVTIYNQNNTQVVDKAVLEEARNSMRDVQVANDKNVPAIPKG